MQVNYLQKLNTQHKFQFREIIFVNMQTIRITTSQNIDIDYEVAGLGERILARLIDMGVFAVLAIASLVANNWLQTTMIKGFPLIMILCFLLYIFYDLICEAFFNGQSVGKRIMKIKVISLDGSRPSLGQYLMRWIFRIVDFVITMQVGALIAVIFTEKKQRIGDLVAGTAMVSTKPRTHFNHIAFMPVADDYVPIFPEAGQLTNSEVVLIHEVISNFRKSDNYPLVHSTVTRLKAHLNVSSLKGMEDIDFLETILRDYNFATASEQV